MNSKIANKNKHLLGDQTIPEEKKCNCRKGVKHCPLNGKCLTESLVYKAEVATTEQKVNYIGMTSTSFKTRFNNHTASFNHKRDSNTSLSNFIWQLKEKNQKFDIKWSILRKAPAFKSETNKCPLCLSEKVEILRTDKKASLNKRKEIFTKCPHRKKLLLCNVAS